MTTEEETPRAAAGQTLKISGAAQLARKATHTAHEAIALLACTEENKPAARKMLESANLAAQAMNELTRAGAVIPEFERQRETTEKETAFDLSALTLLDTSDARELLELLERAQALADRVDASRGRALPESIPLQLGESRGIDLAESISEIALRLRIDVHGPQGRD